MLKKFFIVLVTMLSVFLTQSQVWAAVQQSDKVVENLNIQIDKSTFMVSDEAPAIIARRDRSSVSHTPSGLWIVSIFILGLGQILMGDALRGLKFWLFALLGGLILGIIFYPLASLAILIVYIWNIVDAYNMSQEQAFDEDSKAIDKDKAMALLYDKIEKLSEKVKNSDNGYVSLNALSF